MVVARDFEGVAKNASRVVVIVAGGVTLTPCREGLPAERNDDLFPPIAIGFEPFLVDTTTIGIKSELPRTIEVDPVVSLERPALAFWPRVLRARICKMIRHVKTRTGNAPKSS